MAKYHVLVLIVVFFFSNCLADTFVNRRTGKSFNGYVVPRKKGNKTQVRIKNRSPKYLDLSEYEITGNYLGRQKKIFIFPLKNSLNLIAETEAFERAIALAANQGPLFILIEIDTPGGRIDLAQRIGQAITDIDNCLTVAYLSGGEFGGAFAEAAMVALACDRLYMKNDAEIGAITPWLAASLPDEDTETAPARDEKPPDELKYQWQQFVSSIAEKKVNTALLIKAMMEKNLGVVEVIDNDRRIIIDSRDKKPKQKVMRTWSKKGTLLTLTAEEAVQTGVAEKIADSQKELLAELEAVKARKIQDRRLLRVRRDYEQTKARLDEILFTIEFLENRSDALADQIDIVAKWFRQGNQIAYSGRHGVTADDERYWPTYSARDYDELDNTIIYYNALLNELAALLDTLMRNYAAAIQLAANHPDLLHHVTSLQEGLINAQASFRSLAFRPGFY